MNRLLDFEYALKTMSLLLVDMKSHLTAMIRN
jgi:hypothetical protein